MVAVTKEEVKVDYSVRNRLDHNDVANPMIGELDSILEQADYEESKLVLTEFLIRCIAEAWSTSSEELRAQDWRLDYKESVLWAELRRP